MTGHVGRLAGIARHAAPRAPIEFVDSTCISLEGGVEGDGRGSIKGRPHKRQVSLIECDGFLAARTQAQAKGVEWYDTRRNLLIEGIRIPRKTGTRIRIGAGAVLEITDRCDPCHRMDALHEGLQEALEPDWRCGFLAMVVAPGDIRTGDEIRIE